MTLKHASLAAAVAMAGAVGMVSAAQAAAAPPLTDAIRGRLLAGRNCASCHAVTPRGASPNAAAPPFRSLYRRYPAETLDEAFHAQLLMRHPDMPQIRLTPSELSALAAYIRSLRTRGEA